MRTISGWGYEARVSPLGAELRSFRAQGQELLWQADPEIWAGSSPLLFPIVGSARGDRVTVGGTEVSLPRHGFARRMTFRVIAEGPEFVRHELCDSPETRAVFPRAFSLQMEHRLSPEGLELRARVENTGPEDLPFGIGFHPAFVLPLPGAAGQTHRIRLENGAEPEQYPLEAGLLSRQPKASPFRSGALDLRADLFDEDALVFLDGAGTALRYGPEEGPGLRLRTENLPFLALWSKPGAPFICLEPWHGAAAFADAGPALEERPGSLSLRPGEAAEFAVHLTAELV